MDDTAGKAMQKWVLTMNNKKVLLREYYEMCEGGVCQDMLTEAEKRFVKNGGMMLTGKLQEAEVQNGNGRVYPRKILEREMKNYTMLIKESRALGELDHPDDSVINLKNASHMVTDAWWDGNNVMGKVKVLNTPSGKILQQLVNDGVKLGISSRALGSVNESEGKTMVQEDLQLICFDFVSEPSTPNAYMALQEAKNIRIETDIFDKKYKLNRLLNEILEE
tara:strand:+ start:2376 stop:3038 length:663 start_codon:yes stop_codon:yes gene_type:complete